MTDIQRDSAQERLKRIADLGYSITSDKAETGLQVLVSTHSPPWTLEMVLEWQQANDATLAWISEHIGTISADEIEGWPGSATGLSQGHVTVVSDLCAGARIGIILSHSSETIEPAGLDQARAAALVIQSTQPSVGEFGVTAKELIYLKQVSAGATDDEIADDLQLSLRAVKERKRKAIDDLRAKNISHAIGIAKTAGLI